MVYAVVRLHRAHGKEQDMDDDLIERARLVFVEAWEKEDRRIEAWDRDARGKHTRSRAGINAAFMVFAAAAGQSIRDYWDANGELIDSNNGARLAFEAIAERIGGSYEGPQA